MNKETVKTVAAGAAMVVVTANAVISLVESAKRSRRASKLKKAHKND